MPTDGGWSTLMDLELLGLGRDEAKTGAADPRVGPADDEDVASAVERLRQGPQRVRELVGEAPSDAAPARRLVRRLMGRGLAHPRSAGWGSSAASAACCALNKSLGAGEPAPGAALVASPVIGSAVECPPDGPAGRQLLAGLGIELGDRS